MSGGYILRREVYNLMADTGSPGIFILTDCCSNYGPFFGSWNEVGPWPRNYRRQLAVKNATGHRIRVRVRNYELNFRNDTWGWQEPGNRHYTLEPGAVTTLLHNKRVIRGHRVRLWAETEDGKLTWHEYRDKDLLLTPKEGIAGPIGRFTFTFEPVSED